jgi:hypothetical protein
MRGFAPFLCAGLLASAAVAGPVTTQRKTQFEKAMGVIMASITPNMPDLQRQSLIRDYVDAKPNKAQAVEPKGGSSYFRYTNSEDYEATGDRALESCQLRFGKPCALIAVNDEIAVEGEITPKDMPRLHYAGEFDLAKIPIIRAVTRARADVQGYYGAVGPKAMAIHPWGFLFISTEKANSRDAQDAVLSECNSDPRRNFKDGNCYVYAVDNQVIISERRQIGK